MQHLEKSIKPLVNFEDAAEPEKPDDGRDRCTGCGQFLPADSYYANKCSGCWSPQDDFI